MERKLRRGVFVGGNCTTPPPKWRLKDDYSKNKPFDEFLSCDASPTTVSARKLCAKLWDFESHKTPVSKMVKPSEGTPGRPQNSNGFCGDSNNTERASSLERSGLASAVQYHRSAERKDDRAIQPVSPAGYVSSSMEVVPRKHGLDLKCLTVGPGHNPKTSTELIKVLNRIWSLEEQNSLNVALLKALKMDLHSSRERVKELLVEKESDKQEIDELAKRVTDDKLFRKRVEQDRIRAAVQSVHDELGDERKLRKRSEASHRKLVKEISELKLSLANALRELERERKARVLLENLCDEFAKGVSDYEHEVRAVKHKSDKDRSGSNSRPDRLILHISEAWLDERVQMKQTEAEEYVTEKTTIVDKLGFDIASFLQAKKSIDSKSRRFSLESFPLNEVASAPRVPADGEDSSDCDCQQVLENSNSVGKKDTRGNQREGITPDLVRNRSIRSESCVGEESRLVKSLLGRGSASPVQPWNPKLMTPDFEKSECSLRWPQEHDENTLMTKLIEARLERRRRSSRPNPSKG